jgi:hypothetical protein
VSSKQQLRKASLKEQQQWQQQYDKTQQPMSPQTPILRPTTFTLRTGGAVTGLLSLYSKGREYN